MTPNQNDQRPVIDLREVCCGLVPAILDQLAACAEDEVDVLVRAGIEAEVMNGFGSGGLWDLTFLPSFGHAVARFTRRKATDIGYKPSLTLLDY